ncbi:hypothetical protein [Cupriavidus lacunae]|uniref:Uncharacterized protein n=1 Tax=Cupriavidus lacunae TaxID=2666307 RepID=A0A370MVQ1_9BURK|nr:hypothetical protein [Cupriavidus lacunae]RDJ97386.1 hypothetical protein DN412_42540 [Cupriavidus lacunae]
MPKPNPQSLWTYDVLWSKARSYMERALAAPRDHELFPFWSSLALEFLARSALANVSPVLLAEVSEPDGRNLLHALGLEPKVKNFVPKSIQTSEVLVRCEQIVPDFTKDIELFCRGFTNKRNEELHSGGMPFSALANHTWLPRFYEAATVLLAFQGKSLIELVGEDEAKAAEIMLKAVADETAKSVQKLINAHAEVWRNKDAKEQAQLITAAEKAARPSLGHVVICPACGSSALLTGEEIRQQPAVLEDEELVVRSFILPTELECEACGLTIKGHSQVYAAGLGSQFTNTTRYDPVDYYAEENDDYAGEEYNNE